MKVELLISPVDKEGNRRKAGDIIDVMPSGHTWGTPELTNFLVVPYEIPEGMTVDQFRTAYVCAGDAGEKRKYSVPIATLKACYDYTDAKVEMLYQPFITAERFDAVDCKDIIDCVDTVEHVLTGDAIYNKTETVVVKLSDTVELTAVEKK